MIMFCVQYNKTLYTNGRATQIDLKDLLRQVKIQNGKGAESSNEEIRLRG